MQLTIVLRKEVTDKTEAKNIVTIIKSKLTDHTDITINASTNETIPITNGD